MSKNGWMNEELTIKWLDGSGVTCVSRNASYCELHSGKNSSIPIVSIATIIVVTSHNPFTNRLVFRVINFLYCEVSIAHSRKKQ